MAETKKEALMAFDGCVKTWRVKYEKAVECLIKDRDKLLAFYDFPAEHWKHLNVIESSFATIRHHGALQGMSLEQDCARHDLQARRGRREKLASPQWLHPIA